MEILLLFLVIFAVGVLVLGATIRSSQLSRIEEDRDDDSNDAGVGSDQGAWL